MMEMNTTVRPTEPSLGNGTRDSNDARYGLPMPLLLITITCFSIVFNLVELHLIRLRWTKITNFEVILSNLAVADFFTASGMLIVACLSLHKEGQLNAFVAHAMAFTMMIGMSSSIFYVVLISIERFVVIRFPLKVLTCKWRTSKRRIWILMGVTWVATIASSSAATTVDVKGIGKSKFFMSSALGFVVASYILLADVIVLFMYTWIIWLVLRRKSKFPGRSQEDARNKMNFLSILQKEKSTLIICFLVVLTFLACNTPMAVAFLKQKHQVVESLLIIINSGINPLIYFLKGYIERGQKKKKPNINAIKKAGAAQDSSDNATASTSSGKRRNAEKFGVKDGGEAIYHKSQGVENIRFEDGRFENQDLESDEAGSITTKL